MNSCKSSYALLWQQAITIIKANITKNIRGRIMAMSSGAKLERRGVKKNMAKKKIR